MALEKTKSGHQISAKIFQPFSQIFGESEFAGQSLAVDPIQAAQGSSQIVNWLRSPKVKEALAEALKKLPAKQKQVAVCFSEAFSIFRYFAMPKIEKMYWKKAIPIEARKHVPFALQDCYYDWRAGPIAVRGKAALGVVFAAMRRDVFGAAEEMLRGAGLKCLFVDAIAFAVSRSVISVCSSLANPIDMTKETALCVYLDLEQVQMLLFHHGVPVLTRSIYLADSPGRGSFVLERRKLDLVATLNFARATLGLEDLNRLFLLSASNLDDDSLKNWASGMSEELGLKVEVVKPLKAVIDATGNAVQELADWSDMAAFGLAMRGVSGALENFEVDLAYQAQEAPLKKKTLQKIWAGAVVAGALGLTLGFLRSWSAGSLEAKASRMEISAGVEFPEIKGKDKAAVDVIVAQRYQALSLVNAFVSSGRRFYVTRVLELLADFIPDSAWIESLRFSLVDGARLQAVVGVKSSLLLSLSGKIEMGQAQTESALVQEFFKNLKADPSLARQFLSSNVSFQRIDNVHSRAMTGMMDGGFAAAQGQGKTRPLLAFSIDFKSDVAKEK